MVDIQSSGDDLNFQVYQVGVSDLLYPITVLDPNGEDGKQKTIGSFQMTVSLPHHLKGTNMCRFIEILNDHRSEVTMHTLPKMLQVLKRQLDAETARIEVSFPYFIEKEAPVSKALGLMEYECSFVGESNGTEDDFVFSVKVPVTSLCPCSKEISAYGAHNQRGYVTIESRCCRDSEGQPEIIWIEELVKIAESSASAPVFALLKRTDEKAVTEMAYDNPASVEDIVQDVATKMMSDSRVDWFRVNVVNHESIHNHNSFAKLEWKRK